MFDVGEWRCARDIDAEIMCGLPSNLWSALGRLVCCRGVYVPDPI